VDVVVVVVFRLTVLLGSIIVVVAVPFVAAAKVLLWSLTAGKR